VAKLLNSTLLKKGRTSGLFLTLKTGLYFGLAACYVNAEPAQQPNVSKDTGNPFVCGNTPEAKALASLIYNDPKQTRPSLICNPTLVKVAERKAKDMAERGLVSHFLGGSPNSRLRDAGLTLPDYYGNAMSNQVEALAGGYQTAKSVWHALKVSKDHRQHLLAEIPFYQEQDQIGVAFYKDYSTPHIEYWAVYVTKLHSDELGGSYNDVPDKGLDIVTKGGEIRLTPTKKP